MSPFTESLLIASLSWYLAKEVIHEVGIYFKGDK